MKEKIDGSLFEIVYERCAGVDVHSKLVIVCLLTPDQRETRELVRSAKQSKITAKGIPFGRAKTKQKNQSKGWFFSFDTLLYLY